MSPRHSIPTLCQRAGALAALALLSGCAHSARSVVEVSSPPPPRFGSGPIVAYDAYAAAFYSAPVAVAATIPAVTEATVEAKGSDSQEENLN